MSKISTIRPRVRDLNALEAALKDMGGTLHRDMKTYVQWGSQTRTCDHAISFQGKNMQMGLIKQDNGEYELEYDHMLDDKVGHGASKLMDIYNMKKSFSEAVAMGYSASEYTKEKDGSLKMEVFVMEF
jgi:hypothetical protein